MFLIRAVWKHSETILLETKASQTNNIYWPTTIRPTLLKHLLGHYFVITFHTQHLVYLYQRFHLSNYPQKVQVPTTTTTTDFVKTVLRAECWWLVQTGYRLCIPIACPLPPNPTKADKGISTWFTSNANARRVQLRTQDVQNRHMRNKLYCNWVSFFLCVCSCSLPSFGRTQKKRDGGLAHAVHL